MKIRELANHPGMHMREDAAIQFDLFEKDHGVIGVNRALVSIEEQREVIRRWNVGGPANRPPNLYEPKQPPEASEHVQGIAFDTSWVTHCLRHASPYGFYQRYSWDKPHFEFDLGRVRIRPAVATLEGVDMANVDQFVSVNNKVYAVGYGNVKHLSPAQLTDARNTTGIRLVELTDERRVEAWGNLLDYYAIEPGVVNDEGLVYDPFAKRHMSGGAWSEDRATRAELRDLVKLLTERFK